MFPQRLLLFSFLLLHFPGLADLQSPAGKQLCSRCRPTVDQPVCASDGRYYGNTCQVNCRPDIKIVELNQCKCNAGCPRIFRPVCGSDKKIYINRCLLLFEACQQQGKIKEIEKQHCCKECNQNEHTCQRLCNRKPANAILPVSRKPKRCGTFCTMEYNPVCGSDGRVYGNPCTFNIAVCKSNGLRRMPLALCKTA